MARLAGLPSVEAGPQSALRRVMASSQPVLLAETGQQDRHDAADGLELLATFAALGVGSALIVPCHARAAGVATIIAVRQPGRAPFTPDDLIDLTDLAARAGMVIDTLRRNAREHNNSVALQQALLTAPPQTPGLQIVTRYMPATSGNEIGGDWYDAYVQPDRTPMLVIGDVVGHDIHAAASMGHMRSLIRTVGYTTGGTPADILSQSDAAARGLGVAVLATAVIACVQNLDAGSARLQWTNAGHPPPILITRHGPRLLDAAPDRPLGMGAKLARPRHNHVVPLERGDTVLLYTDGLIERVDEDLDAVIARLMTALDHARSAELGELCDHVLAERGDGTTDDIALLAVRLHDAGPSSSLRPTVR